MSLYIIHPNEYDSPKSEQIFWIYDVTYNQSCFELKSNYQTTFQVQTKKSSFQVPFKIQTEKSSFQTLFKIQTKMNQFRMATTGLWSFV